MFLSSHGAMERLWFLYKFIRSPRQIGSITPSSRCLCRRMAEAVDWSQIRYAAELGSGTGVLTRSIERFTGTETRVLLFEKDLRLREALQRRYAAFPCFEDAGSLRETLLAEGVPYLDCVFSGLPFANFNELERERLLEQIELSLKPGGLFIAFQYTPQLKKALMSRFELERMQVVLVNLPPAFIYICRKRLNP